MQTVLEHTNGIWRTNRAVAAVLLSGLVVALVFAAPSGRKGGDGPRLGSVVHYGRNRAVLAASRAHGRRHKAGPPRRKAPLELLGSPEAVLWPDSSSPVRTPPADRAAPRHVPAAPRGWTTKLVTIPQGDISRYYFVARPRVVTVDPLPVLLVLPGRDMTPAGIARVSRILTTVGEAVVVYPAGYDRSWNAGYCCGIAHLAGINDVLFLREVIRSVLTTQPDTSARQVYMVGFSNGGRMAYRMACSYPRLFAGVAAVEAVPVFPCSGPLGVPVIVVASSGDPLLTVSESGVPKRIAGHVEVTVGALIERWKAIEGCNPTARTTRYSGLTVKAWDSCHDGGRVAFALYHGGAHRWPAGRAGAPSAEELIWTFFQDLPLRSLPVGPVAAD